MIRHYFTCLLAVLIALQSMTAVADVHQFHQSGTQHLEFNHSHQPTDIQDNNKLAKQAPDKPAQSPYDCHHCCHCHGHGSVILAGADLHVGTLFSGKGQAEYHVNLTSGVPPSLFRPPIA